MGSSWLVLVMVAAIFVSMVLLAVVCLDCRVKGPPVSISQANASDEYISSTNFRVIHSSQPNMDLNSIHSPSNLLSPFSSSSDPGTQRRHRPVTPSETESNPSYENPADGPDYVNDESDTEDPGYIIVLPGGDAPLTNLSRASTPSSDVRHDYENVPEKKEERDYLNVELLHFEGSTPDLSAQSDSDDDDDEGNYVNQPPLTHSQTSA
uniref:linker for activation of T-cells family member 1 n=1 Tax=Semicossyphus pulcher TaxID=241346 RepID=UPI0037E8C345